MSNAQFEQVKRLYVSGAEKTLADAIRAVGYKGRHIYTVSRNEGWTAERDENERQKTIAFVRETRKQQLEAARALRQDSMIAAHKAMALLLNSIQSGDMTITPSGAKQIVEIALALQQANIGEATNNRTALEGMSLEELARRTHERIKLFTNPIPTPATADADA